MIEKFEAFIKVLGERVKKRREKLGHAIEDFSKITGIRTTYLKRIEAGNAVGISTTQFFLIAEGLKMEPHVLAEGI